MTDLTALLRDIADEITHHAAKLEREADAKDPDAAPGPFGIAVVGIDGTVTCGGDTGTRFPIQSISKVFALEVALCAIGDRVFERVGREPSGDPFNSIVELERNDGVPRNPFVNAGALVTVDVVGEHLPDAGEHGAVVDLIAHQLERAEVPLDQEVLESEVSGGDLNRAMLSFMKHHGNLNGDPDLVLRRYVEQCAVSLNCAELARAGRFLARTKLSGEETADARAMRMRHLLALMMTCGHYDASGDFALRVGLPAKSGVGGGILAIAPEVAAIAVWSRNLDQNGNSIQGVHALEMLAARTGWSVFGPPKGA
ncbi:glutaminase A [Sphingomonas sp. HHU CXW]|uniref:Glutaminase n=1 Tax=Sphingomonas hominis TaxID=2741495 RepID=A0ABX2JCG6_9SPHN|nr:glutaminase A [Sphingomonas hominis]NTS63667.1 glutaminase A [Sphingomonas hominis]